MINHEVRHKRIGGSEVSAIFHEHHFMSEFDLWARKKGNLPREEPNERQMIGKYLERPLTDIYSYKTGRKVEWCDETMRHPRYEFMAYTPDAFVVGEKIGIDCKVISGDQAWKWGGTVDRLPPHVVMQAQYYMAAKDFPWWHIMALIAGEPRIYEIPADPVFIAAMLKKAEWWWKKYLVGDERPPITASDDSRRWLEHTYPRHKKDTVVRANLEEAALLDEYAMARRVAKIRLAEKDDLEARIKDAIGNREGLFWDGGKFTWKLTKDSHRTNWEALADSLLKDHEAREQLITEFSYLKPGSRRIYFKSAAGEEDEL